LFVTGAQYQKFDQLKKQTRGMTGRLDQARNADITSFQKLARSERVQDGEQWADWSEADELTK
jgi:hypothetical protein